MNHVRIVSGGRGENTHVYLDGKEVDNLVAISFSVGVQDSMQATLTMRCYVDEIDVDGAIHVEQRTRDVVRMSELEALERALMAIGQTGAQQLLELAGDLVAKAIVRKGRST